MKLHEGERLQRESGFTLIEIAIVVVIIGLLLGGVLKGQEMIRNARSHNVADQGNAVKAAILGFSDRYRALPGDYSAAVANIPGLATTQTQPGINDMDGDGNSRIGWTDGATAGTLVDNTAAGFRSKELGLAWLHLGRSGFISGSYDGASFGAGTAAGIGATAEWACPGTTCMTNAFNGGLVISYASQQSGMNVVSSNARANQLWTGQGIPVEVIAELDRKVDDGQPHTGSFQVAKGFIGATPTVGHECANVGAVGAAAAASAALTITAATGVVTGGTFPTTWAVANQVTNCGGVYLF